MDFNLGQKKNCLIGNWSEEKALHDYAGHSRMPSDGPKGKRCGRRRGREKPGQGEVEREGWREGRSNFVPEADEDAVLSNDASSTRSGLRSASCRPPADLTSVTRAGSK
eukprot:322119-Hanusia_phi.AAC.11